ncbi:MAG: DNA mismatch repair endonuclease MutL [Clostridia bacterium]|nr:DNA mismatch repair endonuclease MutL [Clostridia bacterium]
MSIKLLSKETIEQITAGEVVERPVSVAKELIENSIDAGATGITVEIRGGGIEYLRVTDNGCGIEASEIKLAFQNHATSKISNADDLNGVKTMGFRGEALPSIASVSKVSVSTKTKTAATGVRLCVEGSVITEIAPAGCPDGTTITVSDLFYNVPVRRTFLKKPAYEQTLIVELAQKLAMGNPAIAFKLIVNGKTAFQTYGDGNCVHAARAVLGSEYAQGLKTIDESEGTFAIKGFIGVGDQAFPTRGRQCFFLNGRLINCRALSQALEEACRGRVTVAKYPSCVLMVSTPAGNVDVNVHPGKLEVRFKDEPSFRLTSQVLLSRAFAADRMADAMLPGQDVPEVKKTVTMAPELTFEPAKKPVYEAQPAQINAPAKAATVSAGAQAVQKPAESERTADVFAHLRQMDVYSPKAQQKQQVNEAPVQLSFGSFAPSGAAPVYQPAPPPKNEMGEFKLIGVYLDTYIICEMRESLIIIDQHAAHERLNYEKYTKALSEGVASQPLLVPVVLQLTPREMQIIKDSDAILREAGYEVEPFGEGTLKVTAVPFIYGKSDMTLLFEEMIDDLSMLKKAEKERKLDSVIQASCKHAVKGGDKLTNEEIRALLDRMAESGSPPTCPHGRPVMKVFSRRNIEQLFKRIQ